MSGLNACNIVLISHMYLKNCYLNAQLNFSFQFGLSNYEEEQAKLKKIVMTHPIFTSCLFFYYYYSCLNPIIRNIISQKSVLIFYLCFKAFNSFCFYLYSDQSVNQKKWIDSISFKVFRSVFNFEMYFNYLLFSSLFYTIL